jgi:hypothetical protein
MNRKSYHFLSDDFNRKYRPSPSPALGHKTEDLAPNTYDAYTSKIEFSGRIPLGIYDQHMHHIPLFYNRVRRTNIIMAQEAAHRRSLYENIQKAQARRYRHVQTPSYIL